MGWGPAYAHVDGKQVAINEAIGPAYSGLEEAKADVTGIYLAKWLVDQKLLPASELNGIYASYVAGCFVRCASARRRRMAARRLMEFNYLLEHGALARGGDGKYSIDYGAMPAAMRLRLRSSYSRWRRTATAPGWRPGSPSTM